MAKKNPTDNPNPSRTLRDRAEEMLTTSHTDIAGMSAGEIQKLVHKLQVHQMELEIQNEDLRGAQIELAHSRDRYSDLYEFAPVGYLSLDRHGVIEEANLIAAAMLGVERKRLTSRKLTDFLPDEAQETWHLHRRKVFSEETKETCELAVNAADGDSLTVRLESLAFADEDGNLCQCRTALIDVSNLRHARQQLQESEHRYRRLTEAVTDYIYRVRIEHGRAVETIHGANCEAVTGYSPEEFQVNPLLWIAMVPPEDRAVVKRQAADILSNKDAPPIEHRIQRKDGAIRWVLNTTSPQHDDQGRLIAYDGLLRDISERKRAEDALQQLNEQLEQRVDMRTAELRARTDQLAAHSRELEQREQELRLQATAMSNLGEGVLITDDHFNWPGPKIVYVNEAMCRITGYTADELIDETPRILQGDKTDRKTIEQLRQALSEKHSHLCELVNYRKDRTPYDAELFITPVYDAEGNHTNFIAIHRDITERKKIEEALRREHEFAESLTDTAPTIVLVLDIEGRIIRFNPYMEELTGWQLDEVKGRDWFDTFVTEHNREQIRSLFSRSLSGERTRGNTNVILAKDGREREIEWFDAPLTSSEGELIGLLCTGLDVTERRMLEREILEIAAEEQRRIGQDLHDSTQQQLTGLGLLAQNVSAALGQLGGDPAASGLADRIEAMIERATQVQTGLEQAAGEVNQLARGLIPVEVDAQGLMSSLSELALRVNDGQQVECTFVSDGPIEVSDNSTATHLYRIAQEAVNNALKHSAANRIKVALEECNGFITLRILDNGHGIDEKRADGPGMGLRIMAYRADLIGATLNVDHADGGGTEVVCRVRC